MSSGQFPAQAIPLADFKNLLGITLDGPINVRVSRTNSQALSQDQATARAQFVKECESEQPRRAPSAYSQYQPYRYSPEQQLNSCVSRKLAAWQNENPSTVSMGVFVTGDEIIPTWSSSGSSTSRHNTVAQSSYDSLVQSQRFPELGRTPVADIAIQDYAALVQTLREACPDQTAILLASASLIGSDYDTSTLVRVTQTDFGALEAKALLQQQGRTEYARRMSELAAQNLESQRQSLIQQAALLATQPSPQLAVPTTSRTQQAAAQTTWQLIPGGSIIGSPIIETVTGVEPRGTPPPPSGILVVANQQALVQQSNDALQRQTRGTTTAASQAAAALTLGMSTAFIG